MPLSSYHNAHAHVVSKRIKASSRDVIMAETHKKENYETKIDELVFKAQKISQVHLPSLSLF